MKPDHHILTTASLLEEYNFWQHWCVTLRTLDCHRGLAGGAYIHAGRGSQFTVDAPLLQHWLTGHRSLEVYDVLAFARLLHPAQRCLRAACQCDLESREEERWGGEGEVPGSSADGEEETSSLSFRSYCSWFRARKKNSAREGKR